MRALLLVLLLALNLAIAVPAASQTSVPALPLSQAPKPAQQSEPAQRLQSPLQVLLERASALLAAGQAPSAYEVLYDKTILYAGIPEFDYRLGIAALDAGLPGRAILALERVLAVEPNHLQARAEIARAYLANGETEAARRQFESVASQKIPLEVRQVIDGYLAGIARTQTSGKSETIITAELGVGYDSNVNFGSQSNQWLLADGTAVTPTAVSQPRASSALSANLSATHIKPINGNYALIFGGSLLHRSTPSAHTLDQVQMDLSAGLQRKQGCHEFTMQTQYQMLRLNDARFRDATGISGQWRCDLDPKTQLGAFAQWFEFTYPEQSVRNGRRNTVGLTLSRLLDQPLQPVLVSSLYVGSEQTRAHIDALDYRFWGIRFALNLKLDDGWRAFASLAYESRDFRGEEALFGTVRHDRQTDVRLGAEKNLSRQWTIAPQLTLTRNSSSLAPNDFRRTQAYLFARYRF